MLIPSIQITSFNLSATHAAGHSTEGDVFVSQHIMLGTTESVYIDIVTKMWHPPHSATAQRNFLCGRTGSDWPVQGATGSTETYISQLEASTLKLWNNKHSRVCVSHAHTHTQNILSYKNIWPLLPGLLLNSCHTRHMVALTALTGAFNIHTYHSCIVQHSALCQLYASQCFVFFLNEGQFKSTTD